MDTATQPLANVSPSLAELTTQWGDWVTVSLYLDRCQVDTPQCLVDAVWARIQELRPTVGKVVDFGAGDARFARGGTFREYVGYEIDKERCAQASLPQGAQLLTRCAFTDEIVDADICLGNPPVCTKPRPAKRLADTCFRHPSEANRRQHIGAGECLAVLLPTRPRIANDQRAVCFDYPVRVGLPTVRETATRLHTPTPMERLRLPPAGLYVRPCPYNIVYHNYRQGPLRRPVEVLRAYRRRPIPRPSPRLPHPT